MRSSRSFLGAIVFLLAIPVALTGQILFGIEMEIIFHFAGALGFVLIAFSVFDFKMPGWINWIGCLSTTTLAAIFLLQGISQLVQSELLTYIVFQVLGQQLEAWLTHLFHLWWIAWLFIGSRGKIRILGFIVMSIIVGVEAYGFYLSYLGTSLNEEASVLKLLYLPPFVWFLLESKQKISTNT